MSGLQTIEPRIKKCDAERKENNKDNSKKVYEAPIIKTVASCNKLKVC